MAAPAGTPEALITRMNREVNALLDKPMLKERMAAQGSDPLAMTPAAFQARIAEDRARWARVIRDGNIRPD
jgi:tripartite-type tricarboxylate transporter receptor subunit TctC